MGNYYEVKSLLPESLTPGQETGNCFVRRASFAGLSYRARSLGVKDLEPTPCHLWVDPKQDRKIHSVSMWRR